MSRSPSTRYSRKYDTTCVSLTPYVNDPASERYFGSLEAFTHHPSEALYDLTVDPDEIVNLAADSSHAPVIADLRKQLQDWRAATHDPWLAGITDPFGHAH
jgi:hypothetical protein